MGLNFPKIEEKILRFWQKEGIFEKSVEKRKRAKDFIFYEGPPTANGKPGIHHTLSRTFKDVILRYKTMRGFRVLRKAGWDTHGLPVELQIEKKLGLKNKRDIERLGIERFNRLCRKSVWEYKKDWDRFTKRLGYWLDLKHPYITYEKDYIESVWHILKDVWQKGLLYEGFKVVPYCPRCQTTLSSHEVAQGYKRIREPAIYIRFRVLNPEFENTSLLVWTTTPWTLPANVAVAVNPDILYCQVRAGKENLILAKERVSGLGLEGKCLKEIKGKDLVGLRYEPPYPMEEALRSSYEVLPAGFVSLSEGTGLVHIAPAFGVDDMELIKKKNLDNKKRGKPEFPILMTVDEQGRFKFEVKKFAGMFVKEADPKIIGDLRERGILFKEESYEHDYPFCWRCHTPLLYYAKKSWFIKMSGLKKELVKNNKKINWVPDYIKEGRFGEWIRDVKDWALSRERYWGTPLPIWRCRNCGQEVAIGSLNDLLKQKSSANNYYLFRHGHSLRQVTGLADSLPSSRMSLTKRGIREARRAAKRLKDRKIDLIFSSDLLRARQTAQILSEVSGAKLIFSKSLREYKVGIFNGKKTILAWDYLARQKDIVSARLPKGESIRDLSRRMYRFLRKINRKYKNKNIVIVSHELPLTLLEWTVKGMPLEKILELRSKGKIRRLETGGFRKITFHDLPFNRRMEVDLHKPYIDKIKFYCPRCGGEMERVPEVIDCWFDSGSMPFAQNHWPFKKGERNGRPPKMFPADYICEGIDQTRGWFYTLLAVSTLLGFGEPYKNVISLGHVLDEKGEKMSKSKGNVVDPWYIFNKYGADAARWYFYTINPPGEPKLFSEKEVEKVLKRFILTFWNCFRFYETYKSKAGPGLTRVRPRPASLLDKWIISRLNRLILDTEKSMDRYDVAGAARKIEDFVDKDLSLWYIRRSRKRFQNPGSEKEVKEASRILGYVLLETSRLTAPFIPFLSEEIYRGIFSSRTSRTTKGRKFSPVSVHLSSWPRPARGRIERKLERIMDETREVVGLALAQRAKAGIKVRQPLKSLKIKSEKLKNKKELLELIKEEVNVKEVIFSKRIKGRVELDKEITPQLRKEGMVREVIRHIQAMRKKIGLKPRNRVSVFYSGNQELNEILEENREKIMKEGRIRDFEIRNKGRFDFQKEVKVENKNLWLAIKKC